jgi:DMSO/TMAO reductase YedYZ molybdopterin-dependent catalytic subunit
MKGFTFLALSLILSGCIGSTEVREQEITPLVDFFVIDQGTQPDIDAAEWKLEVSGLIYNPLSLGYEDILSFPSLTEVAHLKCIMAGLEGTGKWKGVPLKDILERASVREGAISVVVMGADGYTATLTLDEALRDTTMLAYEMNDVTLAQGAWISVEARVARRARIQVDEVDCEDRDSGCKESQESMDVTLPQT